MPRWVNIANLLTLGRLAAVPFAVRAVLQGEHAAALWIAGLAALTDTFDGALARHFGMATPEGAYFDPIVDKVFLSAIYVSLAAISSAPWWLVIGIFLRDVLILAACGLAMLLTGRRQFPPSVWGKASTFLQILYALALMLSNAYPEARAALRPESWTWVVAGLTAFSFAHYMWRGLRERKRAPRAAAGVV